MKSHSVLRDLRVLQRSLICENSLIHKLNERFSLTMAPTFSINFFTNEAGSLVDCFLLLSFFHLDSLISLYY